MMGPLILFYYNRREYPFKCRAENFALENDDQGGLMATSYANASTNCVKSADLAVEIYALADRFDVPDLKSMAKTEFLKEWYDKYDKHEFHSAIPGLNEDDWPQEYSDIVIDVYATTADSDSWLRNIVLVTVKQHIDSCRYLEKSFTNLINLLKTLPRVALHHLSRTSVPFGCMQCRKAVDFLVSKQFYCD